MINTANLILTVQQSSRHAKCKLNAYLFSLNKLFCLLFSLYTYFLYFLGYSNKETEKYRNISGHYNTAISTNITVASGFCMVLYVFLVFLRYSPGMYENVPNHRRSL